MSKNKRRKTSSSSSLSQSLSTISSGVTADMEFTEADYLCPLCSQILSEPHSTICGHSFCGKCIMQSLQQNNACPQCRMALKPTRATIPNHFLNQIVQKFKRWRENHSLTPNLKLIVKQVDELPETEADALSLYLTERKRRKDIRAKQERMEMLVYCLRKISGDKHKEVQVLLEESDKVDKDLRRAEEEQDKFTKAVQQVTEELVPSSFQQVPSDSQLSSLSQDGPGPSGLMLSQGTQSPPGLPAELKAGEIKPSLEGGVLFNIPDTPLQGEESFLGSMKTGRPDVSLTMKKIKADSCLEEIKDFYYQHCSHRGPAERDSLVEFHSELSKFLEYSTFKDLATIIFGDSSFTGTCIASCIEFNADSSMFAVGGVTQKIKLYDYKTVIHNNSLYSSPTLQLECQSKLSSVSWNKYLMSDIISADYEGDLTLFDASTGQSVRMFKEHEKRSWSVHWNPSNPNLFVSASDDNKVKIWSKNSPNSIATFLSTANVCCCRFHPTYQNVIAFGGADHLIHMADSRNPSQTIHELTGHRKTVSYLEFISDSNIVSASTDSELRQWDYQSGSTIKQYRGHVNEKNFVGLSINGDYIVCGSENNRCFVYEKSFGKPSLEYRFMIPRSVLARPNDLPSDTDFVSSVAWKKDSPVLLAANSHGYIKVLEMV